MNEDVGSEGFVTCLGPHGRCATPDPILSLRHLLCFPGPGPGPFRANGVHLDLRAPEADWPETPGSVSGPCALKDVPPAHPSRAHEALGVRGDRRAASLPVFGIFWKYCQCCHRLQCLRVRGCAEWVLGPERDL